ncbi:BLUF domain-containing protein [Flammeovirga sp. OC4]|uniref:BLUF domain-containing protein n=1 Tax=Flammeovirga sp. OC4 TaxID=1382345 RepID=UPI000693CBC7|nr:BLUF domain-containing protein [Flammeovirga sp. OC4]
MYCLCYVSTREVSLDDDILREILILSRKNNVLKQLTGLLVLLEDKFIQVLEGDESVVEELYAKIKRDDRHKSVQKIYSGTIEERNFNTWSMAFKEILWEDLEDAGFIKEYDQSLPLEHYLKGKNHYVIELLKTYQGFSELQMNLPN